MKIRYYQTGIVLLYILVSVSPVLYVLRICGAHITASTVFFALGIWACFCFSSAYFMPQYMLFRFLHARKPILEEEKKLRECFDEVALRAGWDKPFCLLIEEEKGFAAFALGKSTVVVSKGTLEQLSEAELKAVMAHELGHLESKDCIASNAFMMASGLPQLICNSYKIIRRSKILNGCVPAWAIALTVMCTGYFFYSRHHLQSFITLLAFFYFFRWIDQAFRFLWLMTMRYTEYKQDAFAQSLGYGRELKNALCKMIKESPQTVNMYLIIQNGTHPIVYNRIRRLEKLEGPR